MELERIALKALNKDPGERYQHADDGIAEVEDARRRLEKLRRSSSLSPGS